MANKNIIDIYYRYILLSIFILSYFNIYVYSESKDDLRAAYDAVMSQDITALKGLFQEGLNPDCIFQDGYSLLSKAVQKGNVDLVEVILDAGAGIQAEKSPYRSPVVVAIRSASVANIDSGGKDVKNYEDIIVLLLNKGDSLPVETWRIIMCKALESPIPSSLIGKIWEKASKRLLSRVNKDKMAVLYYSAFSNQEAEKYVKMLIDADVPFRTDSADLYPNASILGSAASSGNINVVKSLLKNGCDPNWQTGGRTYPLHLIASKEVYKGEKSKEMIELLLQHGADPSLEDYKKLTFFDHLDMSDKKYADELRERFKVAKQSIEDMDPSKRLRYMSEFLGAIEKGNVTEVKNYINQGWDINAVFNPPFTVLAYAASHNQTAVVKLLVTEGADVNGGQKGYTPLHRAAQEGSIGAAKALLNAGADINRATEDYGFTPLRMAIRSRKEKMAKFLSSRGGKMEGSKSDSKSQVNKAIFDAAKMQDVSLLKKMLEQGADVNEKDTDEKTMLFYAAALGNINAMRVLLEAGADPNIKLQYGGSAVFAAARGPNHSKVKPMVELMLKHGLDLNIKHSGDTGFDIIAVNYSAYAKELRSRLEQKDRLDVDEAGVKTSKGIKQVDIPTTYGLRVEDIPVKESTALATMTTPTTKTITPVP